MDIPAPVREMKPEMSRTIFLLLFFLNLAIAPAFPQSITTPHFTVAHDGVKAEYARLVADSAERSLARITAALGAAPDSAITIILADTDARFRELTEGTLPDWSAAVAVPGRRIILSPLAGQKMAVEKIVAHEIVHAVIEDNSRGMYVPRWFHEGCAELLSGEWGIRNELYMTWKVTFGEPMSFYDIQNVFSRGNLDAGLAYDQSMLAVRHLITVSGPKTLPRILDGLRGGKTFPRAFFNAAGYTQEVYERDYAAWMSGMYGPRRLITLVPSTWFIMMALFLVVYFIKRGRSKRKLREWERQDVGREVELEPDEYDEYDDSPEDWLYEDSEEYPEGENSEAFPGNVIRFKSRPKHYGGGE